MAGRANAEYVEFEHDGKKFKAVKSELHSYETNKQLNLGGPQFYRAVERLFDGRDVDYSRQLGGGHDAMVGLVNAAFEADSKAKN